MHSTDCAIARYPSVCLFVHLSICYMPVLSLNGYTYLQSFLLLGSPTILVFPHQTGCWYSDGYSGTECKGEDEKNHDFRPISRFIWQIMQDRTIVTMEGELEIAPKLSNGTSLNDLEWPQTQISRSWYHSMSNNSKMVPNRATITMTNQ